MTSTFICLRARKLIICFFGLHFFVLFYNLWQLSVTSLAYLYPNWNSLLQRLQHIQTLLQGHHHVQYYIHFFQVLVSYQMAQTLSIYSVSKRLMNAFLSLPHSLFPFQVSVFKPAETLHTCMSVTDPHYSVLDPHGGGRLVLYFT